MLRRPAHRVVLALGLSTLAALTAVPALGAFSKAGTTYRTYTAPASMQEGYAEPSVAVNWKSGAVLFQGGLETDRITFDAAGNATWTDVTNLVTGTVTLDPVAVSDNGTGRVFVAQLMGFGSLMTYTDDDGKTWSTTRGTGLPTGYDHQSVGVGPYPAGATAKPKSSFPHAVYYCSQAIVSAVCARSDDGGATFGAGVSPYTSQQCAAIHGHLRVARDGTAYLPNSYCRGQQGVAVSRDAGQTWKLKPVPGSTIGESDPSIAVGRDGTAYFSFVGADGLAKVAVTRDRGDSWTTPYDLGRSVGVRNAVFPAAIAGDGDRAAVAFLGTRTAGDDQDEFFGMDPSHTRYDGAEWHLYIATTYDRGRTWRTIDVTPRDPVQRGRICLAGTTCTDGDRNLLDFMDIQVDRSGRVLVAWSDGCTAACVSSRLVSDNSFSDKGNLTRQSSGKGLFATTPPLG